MKNSVYLIILLALGLVFVSYKWISASTSQPAPEQQTGATAHASTGATPSVDPAHNSAIQNIMTRTSVRAYTDEPVSGDELETLLRAAMAAPTAGNKQPWRFVVVDEKSTLKWISENFKSMTMAENAPVAVIMCGDVTATFDGEGQLYWVEDVSAASENLLLAAHAIGLGAVWCGIYPLSERVEQFSKKLGLPSNVVPMACICIGHPSGTTTPKDKWNPSSIHYNTWAN